MTDPFESRIKELAQDFSYPLTPRVDVKVMEKLRARAVPPGLAVRRLAWGIGIVIALLAGLMAVPPVRAAVLEFIQIGIVRIFLPPTPTTEPTAEVPITAMPQPMIPMTATPGTGTSSLIPFLENIAGETTLEEARQDVPFPIPLPAHPADLGEPDHVFLQDLDGQIVVLVWIDPDQPSRVRMSLHMIEAGSWAIDKFQPTLIEATTVNGQRAVWTVGPYPLIMHNRDTDLVRMIDGHVLIWAVGDVTYRLETDLSLQEAIRVAESLIPSP